MTRIPFSRRIRRANHSSCIWPTLKLLQVVVVTIWFYQLHWNRISLFRARRKHIDVSLPRYLLLFHHFIRKSVWAQCILIRLYKNKRTSIDISLWSTNFPQSKTNSAHAYTVVHLAWQVHLLVHYPGYPYALAHIAILFPAADSPEWLYPRHGNRLRSALACRLIFSIRAISIPLSIQLSIWWQNVNQNWCTTWSHC